MTAEWNDGFFFFCYYYWRIPGHCSIYIMVTHAYIIDILIDIERYQWGCYVSRVNDRQFLILILFVLVSVQDAHFQKTIHMASCIPVIKRNVACLILLTLDRLSLNQKTIKNNNEHSSLLIVLSFFILMYKSALSINQ